MPPAVPVVALALLLAPPLGADMPMTPLRLPLKHPLEPAPLGSTLVIRAEARLLCHDPPFAPRREACMRHTAAAAAGTTTTTATTVPPAPRFVTRSPPSPAAAVLAAEPSDRAAVMSVAPPGAAVAAAEAVRVAGPPRVPRAAVARDEGGAAGLLARMPRAERVGRAGAGTRVLAAQAGAAVRRAEGGTGGSGIYAVWGCAIVLGWGPERGLSVQSL